MALDALPAGEDFVLTGLKSPVQDGQGADQLLVSAHTPEGPTQFLVPTDTPGISITPLDGLDLARRFARVNFDGVRLPRSAVVGEPGGAERAIERQLALAVALQCAETVGTTDRAFEMTLQYVNDRKSFGRPIGSYQALKHRLVDMLLWLESSKAATARGGQSGAVRRRCIRFCQRGQVLRGRAVPGYRARMSADARRDRLHLGA